MTLILSPSEMHVQDYGNIAVFFQDLLDTLHVERSVPIQDLRGAAEIEERLLIVAPARSNPRTHFVSGQTEARDNI